MSINFANLVLNPAMIVFAVPMTVDPIFSRPGEAPYEARGIFSSVPYAIQTLEGVQLSDQSTTVGLRLADFGDLPAPHPRDRVTINDQLFFISDYHEDGQGGATLQLRLLTPIAPQHETGEIDVT